MPAAACHSHMPAIWCAADLLALRVFLTPAGLLDDGGVPQVLPPTLDERVETIKAMGQSRIWGGKINIPGVDVVA